MYEPGMSTACCEYMVEGSEAARKYARESAFKASGAKMAKSTPAAAT